MIYNLGDLGIVRPYGVGIVLSRFYRHAKALELVAYGCFV